MTLFDFEYKPRKQSLDIIALRAELIGFRIVWKMRHKDKSIDRKRETRDFLKNRITHFKKHKIKHSLEYERAYELSFECF